MKGFLVGMLVGAVAWGVVTSDDPHSDVTVGSPTTKTEEPTVEVREVKVKQRLSDDCLAEIRLTRQVAKTTREVGWAYNPQEEIISQSFQAIISKDWPALNEQKQAQINLSNKADVLRARLVTELDRLDDVKGSCPK